MKTCPMCGHDDIQLVESSSGQDNVPSWHHLCATCGLTTRPVTLYIDESTEEKAKAAAVKRWELRARVARNEELVKVVDKIRVQMTKVALGCMARTQAAATARRSVKSINLLVEKILPMAKNADIKERKEGRFVAYEDLEVPTE